MVSSITKEPNSKTTDMDSGSERSGIISVARSNTAPPFEKQESILHEMAEFVKIFVVFPQMFSVLSWRNDWCHALCIIAPVCQKILCLESRNQPRCNCAIRCGTRSDKESHRHTMRIHGQMYLGVKHPFVRSIA
jgi:hypothetical protein